MHAGTFDCKLACDSIQTNRKAQPVLFTKKNDPRVLSADFIRQTIEQAVEIIQQAFFDPDKDHHHHERTAAREKKALMRERAKMDARNAELMEDALKAVWNEFSQQCNGKQIQAKVIISTRGDRRVPCVDVDSSTFDALWDPSKASFTYLKADGSRANFELMDVCKFVLEGKPEENISLVDGTEHTFTLSVQSPNRRRILLIGSH